ncbi:MAG: YfiR family protein [Pseudomonadota bacterium]
MALLMAKGGPDKMKKNNHHHGAKSVGPAPALFSFMTVLRISLMALLGFFSALQAVHAQESTDSNLEYRIKAAFLYNFCQFVSWPETPADKPGAPFVFCVIGRDIVKDSIETIAGKMVRGRPMQIRYATSTDDIGSCHLLFVGKSEPKELAAILAKVKNKPILSVGDVDPLARLGGMIGFVTIDGKIRFEINPKAAEAAGLKISSQLLKLAIITDDTRGKEN